MRIRKTSQYLEGGAILSNEYGTSQTDGYCQEYINKLHTYSQSEVRIGTWMGKPLYRKVVQTAPEAVNTWKYLPLNNNMDSCINIYGFFIPTNYQNNRRMILQTTNDFLVQTNNNGTIAIKTSDTNALTTWNIVIEYTKTTD